MINHLAYYLRLSKTPGIGPRRFRKLIELIDDWESFFKIDIFKKELPFSEEARYYLQKGSWEEIEKELQWHQETQHRILTLCDEDYPPLLRQLDDAPPVLYVKGVQDNKILSLPQLAIVGSRNASGPGIRTAYQFAMELSQTGWLITSGLAEGIDTASHQGALAAEGLTIAVLGSGVEHLYPKKNLKLAAKIMEQGVILSEQTPFSPPKAENFPRRNRIISGLSKGVLIVEAAIQSGSLITARYALEQGREVFALPGSPQHLLSKGCHRLIKEGAKLVESTQDIFEELCPMISPALVSNSGKNCEIEKVSHQTTFHFPKISQEMFNLSEFTPSKLSIENLTLTNDQKKVLECIDTTATTVDMIISRSDYSSEQVVVCLFELELKSLIIKVPGGYTLK